MNRRDLLRGGAALLATPLLSVPFAQPAAASEPVDVGIFRFVNPPTQQHLDVVLATLDEIDYPWWRTLRYVKADPDKMVRVLWEDTGNHWALWRRSTAEVRLDPGVPMWALGFIFAHELGHFVDHATFDADTRRKISDLFHRSPETAARHDETHSESWPSYMNAYEHRLQESYAEHFAMAFAPKAYEKIEFYRTRNFTHWTTDLDEIQRLTTERIMTVYDDVDPNSVHADNINRAAELGLMGGISDSEFNPNGTLTRAQAATIIVRLHDKIDGP